MQTDIPKVCSKIFRKSVDKRLFVEYNRTMKGTNVHERAFEI